jgi:S-layer family protein
MVNPWRDSTLSSRTIGSCVLRPVVLSLLAVVLTTNPAAATSPLPVDSIVTPLGTQPNDVAVDVTRDLAYVSLPDTNEIVSVELATGVIQARGTFTKPTGIEVSADNKYLYVALNSSMGIARVDLTDWSSETVVLPMLGDSRTWDVIEVSPGVILVSANPSSSGFSFIVRYDFNTATEDRVASGRLIRGGPRFSTDGVGFVYIGEGFSPNSLYKLDLSTPMFDVVLEDVHGSVSGTQFLAASPDGSMVVTLGGQKLDTDTFIQVGSFGLGFPLFNDDGSLLYSLSYESYTSTTSIIVYNPSTTQSLEEWETDCGPKTLPSNDMRFTKGVGSATLVVATTDSLCLINSNTVRPRPQPAGGRFFDDDSSVHETAIEAIATAGITKGCNPPYQTGFCPKQPVTRGQMAAFLVRALGLPAAEDGISFEDDYGSVFEDDIARLATARITRGCNPPENTRFCPDDIVTRGQLAAFLVRAFGYPRTGIDLFDDDDDSVFELDINALGTAGITLGCNPPENTNFCPDAPVTRAQMATFLTRALNLPRMEIPARPVTPSGYGLTIVARAAERGCDGVNGEVCLIYDQTLGEFYLLTSWTLSDWSSASASDQALFQSDQVRLEATFDGVPIDLVQWPFEIIDNVAYKTVSFQFPRWLDGSHVLDVIFIDDSQEYVWTVRGKLSLRGSGYH